MTLGIRYELPDNQFRQPTTLGIEQNRLRNCQTQFNTSLSEFERSHRVAKLSQIGTQINNGARQWWLQNSICSSQVVKSIDELEQHSFSLFVG